MLLRPVHGDPRDSVGHVVQDGFETHGGVSSMALWPGDFWSVAALGDRPSV